MELQIDVRISEDEAEKTGAVYSYAQQQGDEYCNKKGYPADSLATGIFLQGFSYGFIESQIRSIAADTILGFPLEAIVKHYPEDVREDVLKLLHQMPIETDFRLDI